MLVFQYLIFSFFILFFFFFLLATDVYFYFILFYFIYFFWYRNNSQIKFRINLTSAFPATSIDVDLICKILFVNYSGGKKSVSWQFCFLFVKGSPFFFVLNSNLISKCKHIYNEWKKHMGKTIYYNTSIKR